MSEITKGKLFELKDIEPQLTEKQVEDFKHILFMAKETKDMQLAHTESGMRVVVFPSGKMVNANEIEEIAIKRKLQESLQESEKEIKRERWFQ